MSFKNIYELENETRQGEDHFRIAYQNPERAGQIDIFSYENMEVITPNKKLLSVDSGSTRKFSVVSGSTQPSSTMRTNSPAHSTSSKDKQFKTKVVKAEEEASIRETSNVSKRRVLFSVTDK